MGMWIHIRYTLFLMAGGQLLLSQHARKTRALCEQAFVVHVVTELAGVSLLSPVDGLRLVPYVVPVVMSWRRTAGELWEGTEGAKDLVC